MAAKMNYYKNISKRKPVFQTMDMDKEQLIQQEAFKANQAYLQKQELKSKMHDKDRENFEAELK